MKRLSTQCMNEIDDGDQDRKGDKQEQPAVSRKNSPRRSGVGDISQVEEIRNDRNAFPETDVFDDSRFGDLIQRDENQCKNQGGNQGSGFLFRPAFQSFAL